MSQLRFARAATAFALAGVSLGALAVAPARAASPADVDALPAGVIPAADTPAETPAADAAADAGETIVVTGAQARPDVSAGALGLRKLLDTPFSIGTADAEQIQRLAATTIDAAFSYDAGVRSNNSGVASGNTFSVRGIPIDRTNGYKLDGLPLPYWFQDHPIEHLQDIQILKGAGGFVYGFTAPGGVVNLVSKQPTRDLQARFTLTWRSASILNEHLDVGGPLDRDGNVAFRLNAVNEQGRLYNGAYNKDQFVSLALVGHVTPNLSWQLDGFYQRTRQDDQINTISILTAPSKVNGVLYQPITSLVPTSGNLEPSAKGATKFNDLASVTGRLNYTIAPGWQAHVALRYAALDERFPGSLATIYDNAGDYYASQFNMNRLFKYYVGDAGITGSFTTGPIRHEIVAGASFLTSQFLFDNPTRTFVLGPSNNATPPVLNASNAYTFNIYNPNSVPTFAGNPAALYNSRPPVWTLFQDLHQRGVFASDTLSWGPVSALVGARYTDYEEINFNPNQSQSSYFHYHPVSPVYSLSLAVAPKVRLYATYVSALQRGGIAPASATNPNASFGPLKSTQYEAGIKAEGHWGNATLALYRIATPSEYIDATNTFVRNGNARYQGIEFNATLHPVRDLLVQTSLAWLDAKQVSGPPAQIGQTIAGTTAFQGAVLAEYKLPYLDGVHLTGGLRHASKSYGAGDIFVYRGSTVGDLGARYDTELGGHALTVRANVQNVGNARYWVPGPTGTSITAGAPRTFTVSAAFALLRAGAEPEIHAASDDPSRDGHAYLEIDAGGAFANSYRAAVDNTVTNPAAPAGSIRVRQKAGWDVDGVLGYDFGRVSAEVEAGFKRATNGAIDYGNAGVAVDNSGRGAGAYANAGGRTGVLSVLFNGLLNIGAADGATRGFIGGGLGIARVSTGQWTLDRSQPALGFTPPLPGGAATPSYFSNDNATAFAWQGEAGVRHALGRRLDVVLKYRYFAVPGLNVRTSNGNQLHGTFSENGVLAGLAWKL